MVDAGMKNQLLLVLLGALVLGCDPGGDPEVDAGVDAGVGGQAILPVRKGDIWRYRVETTLTRSDGGEETRVVERVRKYLGEVRKDAEGQAIEAFEIVEEGVPIEQELVRILPDRILACGSLSLAGPNLQPIIFANPVPFVRRGLKGGEDLPEIRFGQKGGAEVVRKIRVIGPEEVEVKAGRFDTIKLLFTGQDGPLGIRRTVWFAEGTGIVREEKERFTKAGGVLTHESHELVAIERSGE